MKKRLQIKEETLSSGKIIYTVWVKDDKGFGDPLLFSCKDKLAAKVFFHAVQRVGRIECLFKG